MSTDVPKELREKLAEYLNKLKDKRNLGFNQLSLKSGINPKSLSLLLTGATKRINPYQLQKIASALRVDYKVLYEMVGYLKSEEEIIENSDLDAITLKEAVINVPVYDSVSAGFGKEPDPQPVDFVTLPKDMTTDCVLINVHDDSMGPTLQNGCRILVKREVQLEQNDIGVFIHNDEALVKRYKLFGDKIYLYSDNQNYPPREIRDGDSFHVCGKVMWIMNRA